MKKTKILFFLLVVSIAPILLFYPENTLEINENYLAQKNKTRIPIPTQVNAKMENETEHELKKDNYFDLIHGNDSTVDWRSINAQTLLNKAKLRINSPKVLEPFAGGQLLGEWSERGSSNQAGNVRITDLDTLTENVYAISDGGILWKGDLNNSSWQSLNDGFVLDSRIIKVVQLPGGGNRIIAAIGLGIWYTDDEGITWNEAGGFISNSGIGSAIDIVQLSNDTIVYLYSQTNNFGGGNNRVAYSADFGANFIQVQNLSTSGNRSASLASPYGADVAYVLNGNAQLYQFQHGNLNLISTSLNISSSAPCQLEISMTSTDTSFYALMNKEFLYKSTNGGTSFTQISTLSPKAWDCGIGISIDNPGVLYYGEVELFRSYDDGGTWNKVSNWYDYYGDLDKIHADIMDISTFKKSDGTEITIIPNHGGINVSYDYLQTTPNVGLNNLNVGQFYDVATSPINASYIFGGTQDQGFQRTNVGTGSNIIQFDQVISGDYGHQQFTNNGTSIWTQYPGGDFSFYENAIVDNAALFWYDIEGNDMPNQDWIVPTAPAPNAADNYILVGGGNLNGGNGSYLIKLWDDNGSGQASQFPFDFKANSNQPISAIETTSLNEDIIYVSTQNGHFYYSTDAGQNFTESTPFNGPGNDWIYSADICASKITPGLVFVGGSGYVNAPVFMSTDGGQNFTPIDDGLENTMVHEMCMDDNENFLFAATDAGPYVYSIAQNKWFDLLDNNAPIQQYISCEYVASESIVRFATWGRGIWDFKIQDASSIGEPESISNFKLYPNPSKGITKIEVEQAMNLSVIKLSGQIILKSKVLPGTNTMNFSHLTKGQYLIILTNDKGEMKSETLVIQ